MKALLQRVGSAEVRADGKTTGKIGRGLLVYLGVASTDTEQHATKLAEKVAGLRIFEDEDDKLNRSVQDVQGGILAVSNFTLLADARKGRRPSFTDSAGADHAQPLYEAFVAELQRLGCEVAVGAFGRHMEISSVAEGPVNMLVEIPPGGAETR